MCKIISGLLKAHTVPVLRSVLGNLPIPRFHGLGDFLHTNLKFFDPGGLPRDRSFTVASLGAIKFKTIF